MPMFEEHCKESIKELGEPFEYVHKWLDEFMGHPQYKTRHRHLRHHRKGIEEIRKKWGDKAAKAAELHIMTDLRSDGWSSLHIPYDEEEFKEQGLW
jgi:hypothetical protein